jgi:general secretion pathway protein K
MKQQQGVALITILVMVALGTILAATIAKRQAYSTQNTAYIMRQNQALLYGQSAEAFFVELLKDDLEQASEVDHLQEIWAQPLPAFPIEDGAVQGYLQDESGKFNLNSLLNEDGSIHVASQNLFERLLVRVGLAPQLVEAVIDWQDAGEQTLGAMGAERSYYQGRNQTALPSNGLFHHIDELKLVRGFEGQNFEKIRPFITVHPERKTQININTAPTMLLASIDEQISETAVAQLLEEKNKNFEYFKDVSELWQNSTFTGLSEERKTAVAPLFGVTSQHFKAFIHVTLSDRTRYLQSDIIRKDKNVLVLQRQLLPFKLPD